ncbi:MAG: hypothetical protein ACLP0L_06515, partial [Solirubrobacteraceae bacterium]
HRGSVAEGLGIVAVKHVFVEANLPVSASTPMAKKSWPSTVAVVSQTWPPITTGVDHQLPCEFA